ncbi:hypothetical protein IAE56_16845 [Stenotrophomonas sp. S41]|nr:hypothetical protein [Stenotrophomonas sp. S41]
MVGSGERIAVAIAAYSLEHGGFVQRTISEATLHCMYGVQSSAISGLIAFAVESVQEHFSNGESLENWSSPFAGCVLGPTRTALAGSAEQAAQLGGKLIASLWRSSELQVQELRDPRTTMDTDQWMALIKAEVLGINPELEARFNREVRVKQGASPTRIGYLGEKIAANFDALVSSNMTIRRQRAKSKLMDLQALRRHDRLLNTRHSYELMLWVPPANSADYSNQQIDVARSAFLELEEFADREDLRVRDLSDPAGAAAIILHAEAA